MGGVAAWPGARQHHLRAPRLGETGGGTTVRQVDSSRRAASASTRWPSRRSMDPRSISARACSSTAGDSASTRTASRSDAIPRSPPAIRPTAATRSARTRRPERVCESGLLAGELECLRFLALPRELQRVKRAPRPGQGPKELDANTSAAALMSASPASTSPDAIRNRPRFCRRTRYGSSGGAVSGVPLAARTRAASSGWPRSSSTSIRKASA